MWKEEGEGMSEGFAMISYIYIFVCGERRGRKGREGRGGRRRKEDVLIDQLTSNDLCDIHVQCRSAS